MDRLTIVAAVSFAVVAGSVVVALRFWIGRNCTALVAISGNQEGLPAALPRSASGAAGSPLDRFSVLTVSGLVAGGLAVAAVMRFGMSWLLPAHVAFVALSVVLSAVDLAHQRLPNVFVVPAALMMAVLLGAADVADQGAAGWLRAVGAASALFAFFLLTAVISPASIGMGDVKLAVTVGLYTGYISWRTTALGALLAFVVAAVAALCLLALRRVHRGSMVPFGPSMLIGAMVAVWITSP